MTVKNAQRPRDLGPGPLARVLRPERIPDCECGHEKRDHGSGFGDCSQTVEDYGELGVNFSSKKCGCRRYRAAVPAEVRLLRGDFDAEKVNFGEDEWGFRR